VSIDLNYKDIIRLGLYTQVVEKLLYGDVFTACVDRSFPGFWEYLMRSNRPKQCCRALWTSDKLTAVAGLEDWYASSAPRMLVMASTSRNEEAVLWSRSKLELKSNLSEILPVNCKFIYNLYTNLIWQNSNLISIWLKCKKKKDKFLCITWIRHFLVQFKFAFRIRPFVSETHK